MTTFSKIHTLTNFKDMSPERIAQYENFYTQNSKVNIQESSKAAHTSLRKGHIHFTHKITALVDSNQLGLSQCGDLDLMLKEYNDYTSIMLQYLRQLHDYGESR